MTAAEPGLAILGTFREAADLTHEVTGKLRDAWSALLESLRRLPGRTFAGEMRRELEHEVEALVARVRPEVETIIDVLASAASKAVPVLPLFDAAVALFEAADHLGGLSAEMTGRGDLELWTGAAREAYDLRVREQAGAADAAADDVLAVARWLAGVGEANTAYLADVGLLGADLLSRVVAVVVEAEAADPVDLPRVAATMERLAVVATTSVERTTEWAGDLQNHLSAATRNAEVSKIGIWPSGNWPSGN